VLLAMKLTLCLLPFAAASVPLLWFNFGRGDAWAHSLFNTQHPLNFGGNPSEVFSHLLNCIVMAVAISTLCVALLITLWGQCHQLGSPSGAKPDLPLFVTAVASVLATWAWAAYLDSRSGEGTVALAFILFFAPATGLSSLAARRLSDRHVARLPGILAVLVLWAVLLGMIWLYEPSGTGGPNILVIPLLTAQVGLFWFASGRLGKVTVKGEARTTSNERA